MTNTIELHDFIQNTLVQIALGVKEANDILFKDHEGKYSRSPFRLHNNQGDNNNNPGISFDVAVTASEASTDKAGAKISFAGVLGIDGSTEDTITDAYVHRIRFTVGIHQDWD